MVRYLTGTLAKTTLPVSATSTLLNGSPALVVHVGGEVDGMIAVRVEDGRVSGLYYVRNPDKLPRVGSGVALSRR